METKRRVLYISYDCILEPLTASQVLPYLKGLARDNDIFLLAFNKRDVSEARLFDIAARYGLKGAFGLRYHKTPTLPATCLDIVCGITKCASIIKKYDISLVHARSYVACAIAFALKRLCGTPYIFDVRGLLADERVEGGDWKRSSLTYGIVKFFEVLMLRESSKVILLSYRGVDALEAIEKGSRAKTTVIPTCVDTESFASRPSSYMGDGPLRLIYIGSLGTWYMLPEMLDFFKIAREIVGDVKFLILTWSDPAYVLKTAQDKGLGKDAIEVRRESHDRIPSYLAASDVSIFFIRPTFSKSVSCPTKFAESLSAGLPVVTNSGIGDLDYFINRYSVGVVITDLHEDGYRKAARDIVGMLKDRNGLSERCRSLALGEFSLESGVERYEKVYESIIPPHPALSPFRGKG